MKSEDRQQLARIIAVDGERESDLSAKIQQLRQEVNGLESYQSMGLPPDAPKAQREGMRNAQVARAARISAAKEEIASLEVEIDKLIPTVAKARKALGEIDAGAVAERRLRCARIVERAAAGVPIRQQFFDERARLVTLQGQLTSTEAELHALLTDLPAAKEAVTDRALRLLEGGTMIPDVTDVDVSQRAKTLTREVHTLTAAVEIQGSRVNGLQYQFCVEIAGAIRPEMEDVVKRIATGMELARGAVLENVLIRTAVAVCTGGHNESLPTFTYAAIDVPTGGRDGFDFWLDAMRRQGFAV
jgi:hypothetical protein